MRFAAIPESAYAIEGADRLLTPSLAIYVEQLDSNIAATIRLLGGNPDRWRPHVKTAKLAFTMKRLVDGGVMNFKCATTLELRVACEAGGSDVLVAYPLAGQAARRVIEISKQHTGARISSLVEDASQIEPWAGSAIGLFIDVNPGMDRTGIEQQHVAEIVRLARKIRDRGHEFRGLHYYDGHLSSLALPERETAAHSGYHQLMGLIGALDSAGVPAREVITAGTPAFPCTLSYPAFREAGFIHRASPGTVVYGDMTSMAQLPAEYGYRNAALIVTSVVSRPSAGRVTCDAGHKTVSADAGVPTCAVIGRNNLDPAKPSEEHLPIDVRRGAERPELGDILYLVPRHVCPTVNNFDHALIVKSGRILSVERVTGRGREAPL
jgi:D-serine deaminase-like pyridoxal phosphate-dependent protein